MEDEARAKAQVAELTWTKGRLSPEMHEFRGVLGKYYRIVFGEDRAQLEAQAREMAAGRG